MSIHNLSLTDTAGSSTTDNDVVVSPFDLVAQLGHWLIEGAVLVLLRFQQKLKSAIRLITNFQLIRGVEFVMC